MAMGLRVPIRVPPKVPGFFPSSKPRPVLSRQGRHGLTQSSLQPIPSVLTNPTYPSSILFPPFYIWGVSLFKLNIRKKGALFNKSLLGNLEPHGRIHACSTKIWGAGCTVFELATGQFLFTGRTNTDMLHDMMKQPVPKLGVPFLGVSIKRIQIFWGLYGGRPILGNYYIIHT